MVSLSSDVIQFHLNSLPHANGFVAQCGVFLRLTPFSSQRIASIHGPSVKPPTKASTYSKLGISPILCTYPKSVETLPFRIVIKGGAGPQARAINPSLPIIARAHSEAETLHLKKHGASMVVMGEHEIAKAMLKEIALPPQVETAAVFIEPELDTEKT